MSNKKEIKRQYKEIKPLMGVYRITNKVNGKVYIGSGKNVDAIVNRVRFQLKNGLHLTQPLQKEYLQYGDEQFSIEVVDILEPKEGFTGNYENELLALEELWLEKLLPYDENGYNIRNEKTT